MITIIDYNAGNLTSVKRALTRLGIDCEITDEPKKIAAAKRIIFPGVGNAASAMRNLNSSGIADALKEAVGRGVPFFGICLGMQIMLSHSDEGGVGCLDLFKGTVRLLTTADRTLKIPHMGWDSLKYRVNHAIFDGIDPRSEFYFVHSFYADPTDKNDVVAVFEYGAEFTAVVGKDNMFASQFHPEKSGEAGLKMLENFSKWKI
jgi:glutamine amidotransferase